MKIAATVTVEGIAAMPSTNSEPSVSGRDFGPAMRILTIVVLLATTSACFTVGLVLASNASAQVQAHEVDLAGKQRLLTERIARGVAELRIDPTDPVVRTQLVEASDLLTDIRLGLTRGDRQLGLDGVLPTTFSSFYDADGLDLDSRMGRFERAAGDIAASPLPPSTGPMQMLETEVLDNRLVSDLDQAVAALAAAQTGEATGATRVAVIGVIVMGGLGLLAIAALVGVRVRLRRQIDALADAMAEIGEQERRLRLALEHVPTGVALVAADGTFITVNDALCELTGRNESTLLEHGLAGLLQDDSESGVSTLEAMLRPDHPDTALVELRTTLGVVRTIRLAVGEISPDADDEQYRILSFSDLTQEQRAIVAQTEALEREQEAVAKHIELEETRSEFVANISHELRTPLTSMIGYLEIVGDGDAGDLNEQQQRMIATATRNGQRLGRLIDDLLTLSVGGHGDASTMQDVVDLSTLADDVVDDLAPRAADARVTLAAIHDDEDRVHVRGNRRQLQQVLHHVVGNAIKFTPSDGHVRIEVGTDPVDEESTRILVTDTGIGISTDEQDRLFERFFRSERARADEHQGSGLGLAIAHRLVDAHEGHIEIESIEDEGTEVTIILPRVEADAESGGLNSVLWPMGSRLRDEFIPRSPVS